jgi:hypothetical protein
LPLVHDIPLSLTIKQQYQISSLATFLENQVSISFYLYSIIYINTQSFTVAADRLLFFVSYSKNSRSMLYLILLSSCSIHSRLKPIILHRFTRRCRQTNMSCIR